MTTTVRAVYENQTLRLDAPLPFPNGAAIEVTLNLPEPTPDSRKRFSWEDGPILPGDGYAGDITEEVRRQRDEEPCV